MWGRHCVILLYILFSYMDALPVFILRAVLGNISYLRKKKTKKMIGLALLAFATETHGCY